MTEYRNESLIQELYTEMNAELDKGEHEMNTQKIRRIVLLLEELEGRSIPPELEKERFFQEFEKTYGIRLSPDETVKSTSPRKGSWKKRLAAVAALLGVVLLSGNAIAVTATDNSLWRLMQETSRAIYYHTVSNSDPTKIVESEDLAPVHYEAYETWDALKDSLNFPILSPEYIPESLSLESLETTQIEENHFIYAYYTEGEQDLFFSCSYILGDSSVGVLKDNGSKPLESRQFGTREVLMSTGDTTEIFFSDEHVFYKISSNLPLEEIEYFVENLN